MGIKRQKEVSALHQDARSLTEGSIWKSMLLFALPIFWGNLFQQFYNAFDSWVVGRFLGDTALAAVSSSATLIFMMVGFFNGVAMGAGIVIARYFGARDYDTMNRVIHTDLIFGLMAGVLLTFFGVTCTPIILGWMGTPAEVMPQSVSYFRYYSFGAVFCVLYNVLVGILHAVGDSRHPLYYLMISTVVNVVLDLLFVGVFRWGVGAAAMATTISQGISALLCFLHLLRVKEPYRLDARQIRFDPSAFRSILRMGIPSGVQNSVIAIANVVVQSNINFFGAAAMAGCGSYSKLEGFAFLPITCFSMALSTFVGQNLGARNYDRVRKGMAFGILCPVIAAELVGVVSYLLAPKLIAFFNDSPEVVAYGTLHMRTICLFYCLLSFSHCIAGILRGAGKTTVPMAVMLVCWCLIRVTYISVAVGYAPRLQTVSWAYPITWSCSSIVFLIYFLKADWMHAFERIKTKA